MVLESILHKRKSHGIFFFSKYVKFNMECDECKICKVYAENITFPLEKIVPWLLSTLS